MAFYIFLVLSLFLSYNVFHGRSGIAEQEGLGFQAPEDNGFECVDIYKQPAFKHPLLKNHKIQSRPSFPIDSMRRGSSSYLGNKVSEVEQLREGCPPGKVPIQKIKSYHLWNRDSYSESHINQARHYATVDMLENTNLIHGAGALTIVYNPRPALENQFSKAQVWLERGPLSELNIIEVGWAVHRSLYSDNGTHLTAYWTIDNSAKTGCYNLMCPGFVQVDDSVPLGARFKDISIVGGKIYNTHVFVKQDRQTGHWWLIYLNSKALGYWPKEIFTHLTNGASSVRYGGEVLVSLDGVSPPMGSGELPSTRWDVAGLFGQLEIVDDYFVRSDINRTKLKKNCDTGHDCYDLFYLGNQGSFLRQTFTFGGPGGNHCPSPTPS